MKFSDAPQLGFWQHIHETARTHQRPIFSLAPMANVTDAAFRTIIAARGKPDVLWTEFVSADGLARADERGRAKLLRDLVFTEAERPIVAQFFTATPEYMERAAALAVTLGFDGVDINMGCPDRAVERQGAGAALIKTPARAREIIAAAKTGAGSLPVSVKTRLGWNTNQLETWLPELLAEAPAVITVHARTRKEMSKVPARWEDLHRAVEIRNSMQAMHAPAARTLIFGNGDARDLVDATAKAVASGVDGVMLGRAIFGNPWLFSGRNIETISVHERITTLIEHIKLFDTLLGDIKSFALMKKHFKAYIAGWDGAALLRAQLMETNQSTEAIAILTQNIS